MAGAQKTSAPAKQERELNRKAGTTDLGFQFNLTMFAAGLERQAGSRGQTASPDGLFDLWAKSNIAVARKDSSCKQSLTEKGACDIDLGSMQATIKESDKGIEYDVHKLYPD